MKRNTLTLITLLILSVCAYAQAEEKKDSISINIKQEFPNLSPPELSPNKLEAIENETLIDPVDLKRRVAFVKALNFQTPLIYHGPISDDYPLGRILPGTNEYAFGQSNELNESYSISIASYQRSYIGIGDTRMVAFNVNYKATDWLTVSGGAYGAKYNMPGFDLETGPGIKHYNDLGINASLRFKIHERIALRAHGQYSINSNDRNRGFGAARRGMFPQTYYGAGMEFKINDNFGVEAGVVREFDPGTRKWSNMPYIAPIFYSTGRRK